MIEPMCTLGDGKCVDEVHDGVLDLELPLHLGVARICRDLNSDRCSVSVNQRKRITFSGSRAGGAGSTQNLGSRATSE